MEEYKELDDPVEEVYRIRLALLKEHGGIDGYHAYLRETGSKWKAMGFHSVEEKHSAKTG